ncbi:MAG: efflux RND transporter permease subunit [Acidobacteriota bacterium]
MSPESTSAAPLTGLVRAAIDRPVTLAMAVAGVLVLGGVALTRLPLEFQPTFSSSNISVQVPFRSSSPEEIERAIVRPLEDSFGTLNGLETLSATATSDAAQLRLSFLDGTDMDLATVEVRDRIDRARQRLPDDIDRITIRRFQSTDIPVLRFQVSSDGSQEALFDFAENTLRRRLERLDGVALVEMRGLRTPRVEIDLDPDRLAAHGLDARSLGEALRRDQRNLSAGDLREGGRKLLVRALGELDTVDAIRRLPVGDGTVRLSDVATVTFTLPEQEEFSYLNGVEALTVQVYKASTANLLAVAGAARAELDAVLASPAGEPFAAHIYHDSSQDVEKGLAQLRNTGLFGGVLAIFTILLFLRRWRPTLLVAIAVPVSVIATFVLMFVLRQSGALPDLTLNVVSLAGLMLALGMLVDNSVVVIESIFRHRNDLGQDARTAALVGTAEVALPIVASTATTLCVFLPLTFLTEGGRLARYFQNIASTLSIVIAASLVVALTVVPAVARRILVRQEVRPERSTGATDLYVRTLAFTLRHRALFLVLVVALLGGSIYLMSTVERSFSARTEERQITLLIDTPRQYTEAETRALYEGLYERIDTRRQELDIADISYTFDTGTGRSGGGWSRDRRIEMYLVDEAVATQTTAEARNRLRGMLPEIPGVGLRISQGRGQGSVSGVEVELTGDNPEVLARMSQRIADRLATLPRIRDVDTSLDSGDEEIHLQVDRERANAAGLSTLAVASTVSGALSDRPVAFMKTADREVDLVLRYREDRRETLQQLQGFPVGDLPLSAYANFETVPGPRSIQREDRRSQVTITANTLSARDAFAASRAVSEVMSATPMPPGTAWSFGRWSRFEREDRESGNFALVMALVLVYLLMAALFESFVQPLTILFSVPFALIGVALLMRLTQTPWDNMTTLGLVILLGVVVNNAIVLIDHINGLRAAGLSRDKAILAGGRHRLRPIAITAVTTLVGLLPMVAPILAPAWFGPLEGRAATWAPIGLVIFGGLTTSTFLTLMIIPTIYSLIDDFVLFAGRVLRAARGRPVSLAKE